MLICHAPTLPQQTSFGYLLPLHRVCCEKVSSLCIFVSSGLLKKLWLSLNEIMGRGEVHCDAVNKPF